MSKHIRRIASLMLHTSPLEQAGTGDAGGMNVYVVESAKRIAAAGVGARIWPLDTLAVADHSEQQRRAAGAFPEGEPVWVCVGGRVECSCICLGVKGSVGLPAEHVSTDLGVQLRQDWTGPAGSIRTANPSRFSPSCLHTSCSCLCCSF